MKLTYLNIVCLCVITSILTSCAFNGLFYETKYAARQTIERSGIENAFEFKLKNEKGREIHTAFIASKIKAKGSVFLLHGNAGPIGSWITMSEMYTNTGYNFYIMDYEGFGESQGKPTHKNLLTDAQLALNHFLKLDEVKNTSVVIHGISIGGHLAVKLTEQNLKNINVLVLDEAFSSHKETAKINGPGIAKPFTNLLVKDYYPATEAIKKVTIPILIMASTKDETAPYWMSEKLFKNCPSVNKELWDIGGAHGEGLHRNRKAYIGKLNGFIKL